MPVNLLPLCFAWKILMPFTAGTSPFLMITDASIRFCRKMLCCWRLIRPPSVYAPRPIFYDSGDLPQNREIFLFGASPARTSDLPQGYTAAQQLYFNPAARWNTFRTPRRPVEIGPLYVTLLQRNPRALQNPAKNVGVSTVSP